MNRIPVIDLVRTGDNMTKIRTRAGISVRQLQLMLGFSTPQAIYKWQQGKTLPTIDNLVAFSCICNVRLDEVLIYEDSHSTGITA